MGVVAVKEFFSSTRFRVLLGVFVLLVSFLLRSLWTGGFSPMMAQILGSITAPAQQLSSGISGAVSGFFGGLQDSQQNAQENEELRLEIADLKEQLVELESLRRENERLVAALGIQEENPDFEIIPAGVIGRDYTSRFGSFTIDQGSFHGISPRDPVISEEGLVGIISEVGLTHSKVVTILDTTLNVGAVDNRTRESGIISGDAVLANEGLCRLSYLDRESSVAVGDLIITSGSDSQGLFPKGLVIGDVTQVLPDTSGLSLYAVIEPASSIYTVQDVYVITQFLGQGETAIAP